MTSGSVVAPGSPPPGARVEAGLALLVLAGVVGTVVAATRGDAWYLVATLAGVGLAVSAVWIAVTRPRWRWLAVVGAVLFFGGATAALWASGTSVAVIAAAAFGMSLSGMLGSMALRREMHEASAIRWRAVPAGTHPVLLMNPKSGGGKVARHGLERKAAARGIQAVVLKHGDDLGALAEAAVARGADVIGMAGGDGSQALVASVAAEHGVAYVCVPAGTRNHLALDLGVDRDDVVGALDAFGPAYETSVDLASVGGRTFVNNVSLGLYAAMVASEDYREDKAKTALATLEQRLGPGAPPFDLHVDGPDGPIDDPQVIQISNNPYALRSLSAFGTRPRIDTGRLGVVTARIEGPSGLRDLLQAERKGKLRRFPGVHEWTAATVEIRSSSTIRAGVDGESASLEPPLLFECLPGALRVRVARVPAASPAVRRSPLRASTVAGLWSLVLGRPSGLV